MSTQYQGWHIALHLDDLRIGPKMHIIKLGSKLISTNIWRHTALRRSLKAKSTVRTLLKSKLNEPLFLRDSWTMQQLHLDFIDLCQQLKSTKSSWRPFTTTTHLGDEDLPIKGSLLPPERKSEAFTNDSLCKRSSVPWGCLFRKSLQPFWSSPYYRPPIVFW